MKTPQVIGNHEFDFNGPAGLAPYIDALQFPILGACNADTSAEPIRLNLKKWTIVNTMGLRIAIVGWITPDTPSLTGSVGKVTFKPVVESVRQCIKDLKRSKEGRKVDLIVGLSHTGYDVSWAGQGRAGQGEGRGGEERGRQSKAGGCPAVQRQLDFFDSC